MFRTVMLRCPLLPFFQLCQLIDASFFGRMQAGGMLFFDHLNGKMDCLDLLASLPFHSAILRYFLSSVLGQILYTLCLHDVPNYSYTRLGMFSNDTVGQISYLWHIFELRFT